MRILKRLYLNVSFYLFFLIFSAVSIPLLALYVSLTALTDSRRNVMRRFRKAINLYGRGVLGLPFPLVKVKVEDFANCESSRPYIFVCNHRSTSDPFLMGPLPVELVQVVNTWPFKIPVLGFFAKHAGYLNVNALSAEEFFKRAITLLREDVSIVFFPEGTRSGTRNMGNFHGAAFRLFLESKVPMIPVCICGNEEMPKKGSFLLEEGVVKVRLLPPIHWEDCKGANAYRIKNMVRAKIETELALMEGMA